MTNKKCPLKSICQDYQRAMKVLNALHSKHLTMRELQARMDFGNLPTLERICTRLYSVGALLKSSKMVNSNKGKFNKDGRVICGHRAKTYKARKMNEFRNSNSK